MRESLGQYRTRDGKSLFYRKWSGPGSVIVYLHGIESNSGWFSPFASLLNEHGFVVYGIDRRGSGFNAENKGDIVDYNIFLDDIEDALHFVREQNIGKRLYLAGICWGGLLAVNYATKIKLAPDGLILLSPAICRKVDLNPIVKALARACFLCCPEKRFKIPIMDRMFTSNERYLDFIKKDKMRIRGLTCRFLNGIIKMERDFGGINHRITLPVAVLLSGYDEIVDNERVKKWFEKVKSADKAIKIFEGMRHVMPFEDNIAPLVNFIADWIKIRETAVESPRVKN